MKEIKSHTSLPECILKRFSEIDSKSKKRTIYYYDFNENKIKKGSPGTFNTEVGYYTNDNEKRLQKYAENKIGEAISYLEIQYKKNEIKINPKNEKKVKHYISYQLIRNDSVMEFVKNTFKLYKEEKFLRNDLVKNKLAWKEYCINHSIKELKNLFIELESEENLFFESLLNLGLIVLFNKSNSKFVLTSSSAAIKPSSNNEFAILMTLTNEIGLILMNKDYMKEILGITNGCYLGVVNDENIIDEYNDELYESAKKYKPNYIIGSKSEIEKVIDRNINREVKNDKCCSCCN